MEYKKNGASFHTEYSYSQYVWKVQIGKSTNTFSEMGQLYNEGRF